MLENHQDYLKDEGIAIIGIGCLFPKARNKDQYWINLINCVDGIVEVPKERWNPDIYYSQDRQIPDKTYQKIGGFVDEIDPAIISTKYKIPPKTVSAMDRAQKYAIIAAGEALDDSGYSNKDFDRERTAVIIGNSMGGDMIDYTNFRVFFSDIEEELSKCNSFSKLDEKLQAELFEEFNKRVKGRLPGISEDSLPGELSNVIAGRICNVFNLRGPNFSVDAACASSIASLSESVKGLRMKEFDMVITGGSDFMMAPWPYIKFSKIGALSPDGSRPFDAKANGFVMGEGVGLYVLKRVSDARKDGDKIYAVIRGIGASSDGKGKGITAPNPEGQKLALRRAFQNAGYTPGTVQLVEAHGTATIVGDVVEVESLCDVWKDNGTVKNNSVAIGSVKSMIGHLKSAAGAASIIKTALGLNEKIIPPSINFEEPNPNIDFANIPFRVVTEAEEWPEGIDGNPRRANVSAFGFGGTNFHLALEEDTGYNGMPKEGKRIWAVDYENKALESRDTVSPMISDPINIDNANENKVMEPIVTDNKRYLLSETDRLKLEGEAIVFVGSSPREIESKISEIRDYINSNSNGNGSYNFRLKDISHSLNIESNEKDFRLGISASSIDDLLEKVSIAEESLYNVKKRMILKNKGIFFGEELSKNKDKPCKIGFLFPGQGSQYINMMKDLYNKYSIVKETYDEADEIIQGIIGGKLSEIIFQSVDVDEIEMKQAENRLKQTEVTQPSVLTASIAMHRLLLSFGVKPDIVIGHSLGEYSALVAAGVLSFRDALIAVSARGKEIATVNIEDRGKMASISTDSEKVEEILKDVKGYTIIANKNCYSQTVVSGSSSAIVDLIDICSNRGISAQEIKVSHAFHSKIVEPACSPFRRVLEGLHFESPKIDILSNLNADYYPKGKDAVEKTIDILEAHIANPVEFIKQIERMYSDGVRVFVEVGPKRTLTSFAMNIIGKREHLAVATNHPKRGGISTLNDSLSALSAYGIDIDWNGVDENGVPKENPDWRFIKGFLNGKEEVLNICDTKDIEAKLKVKEKEQINTVTSSVSQSIDSKTSRRLQIEGRSSEAIFKEFQEKQENLLKEYTKKSYELMNEHLADALYYKDEVDRYNINFENVVVSGVSVGLPGIHNNVFSDDAFDRILDGENMIDNLSKEDISRIVNKNIKRLVKSQDGEAYFESIEDESDAPKLSGMMGNFDLVEEFGVDADFANSLDISSKLAIAAGIEALRDAGIPLVRIYKETSTGGVLPLNWVLPDYMKDDTGIIFASSLPGGDSIVEEVSKFYSYKYGKKSKSELIKLYSSFIQKIKDEKDREELTDWYTKNYSDIAEDIGEDDEYQLNRKLLLRFLAMGHSQLAQYIGARGPSIQLNTACSSTPAAIGVAEDWIRTGRAKRVIVVGSDSLSSERLREWILSGFIAIGAHSTEADYRKAALPFDKRRNGMIVGMGAVGVVIEAESDLKMRGMEPIAEVIATDYCNSAFHATRLDVDHISFAMDRLLTKVERLLNIERKDIADKLVYMAHETYTPPRGSIGAVEAESLRRNFKERHKDIVVTNTKGLTGHAMGAGIEDVVLLKALQTGKVPPIANYKEYDPVIGDLKLSKGGYYNNIEYGMRLGAGFGSQLSITFMKLKSKNENRMVDEKAYSNWLQSVSGINDPELEVVSRTLRIKDDGSIAKKRRQERKDRKDEQKEIISQKSYMPQKAIDLPSVIEEPKEEVSSSVSISSNEEVIRKRMLEIVSEKTGYPEDLIEFDLDMESDLGIDTVKQAEMFGLIRESFNIPSEEGIKIKDFPTLNHVIDFVKQKSQSFHDTSSADDALIDQGMTSSDIGATNAVSSTDVIRKRMLEIVSEKTGYPEDLIEFDLDMESDLGIDTVKQAEMFGLIRESFNIPSEEGIKIKDFPTLNHVVNFVKQKSQSFISVESSGISHERIIEKSTSESSIKRMIVRMVEEPIEIDKDPRFDLSVFNILITDDGRGIAESLSKKFTDSNAHVEILYLNNIKDDEELVNRIEGIELSGKINGLVHLTPLEESKFISELSFDEWKRNTFLRVKSLFIIVKHLHIDLIDNAKSAKSFIVGATPLGGYLGFDEFTGSDPIGGGVTGLLKSFDKELNNVLVKSIDFSMKMKPSNISQSIFNEIQYGDVRIEQGYIGKKRFIPEIITSVLETDTDAKVSFDSESVFIITGGGYGITSEFAKDIAKHFNSHIVIISRQGLPENIEEIASLDDLGLKELKDKVIEELKSSNDKVTPVMIEKEFGKYTNAIEKYRNVQEMKSLGASSVEYCNCDVSDHDKMFETIGAIRSKYKRVDAIIHGAGLEQSKLLEDKSYEDFCRIFDVKADGCYNLIELTKDDNVKSLVIFSSISARFGNAGQSDYSSANDLLCKYTQQANKRFKGSMRAVSIDWTGWKDVGMATRGSLLTIFENAGVDLISLEDGVRRAREEMLYGDEGEVLIAGSLGDLDSDGLITNMSKDIFELENRLKLRRESCPLIDKVLDYKPSEILVVGKRLDVERDIYLKDHMIEDIPYLPAVMGIESFAEAASLIFPNMVIDSMRDIRFHIPVKLLKDSSVDILISVERVGEEDGIVELQAKLETEFFNKDGKKLGDNRVHFTASIFLKDGIANLEGLDGNGINMDSIASYNQKGNITISYSEIYKRFFHGPRFQVHGGVLEIDNNTVLGVMRETEEELFDYVKKPIFKSNPMAFEAAFQNAGVLEMKRNNVMSLPDTIDELHFRSVPDDIDNLFLMAIYRGGEDNKHSYDIEVVDKDGNIYSIMKGYKMIITGVLEEGEKL